MADQDWTPVTIKKTLSQKTAGMSSAQATTLAKIAGAVSTEKKFGAGTNKSAHASGAANLQKIEDATDLFAHKTVNANLSKAIQQARVAKKMTQQQLATTINEKVQVIQQYEAGSAIPNAQIINKLDRALGIHLPRK